MTEVLNSCQVQCVCVGVHMCGGRGAALVCEVLSSCQV